MTQDADGNMRVESSEHDLEDELDWFAQARVGSRCAQGRAALSCAGRDGQPGRGAI